MKKELGRYASKLRMVNSDMIGLNKLIRCSFGSDMPTIMLDKLTPPIIRRGSFCNIVI